MPFIHMRAYSGRTPEIKLAAAQAMVKAASEAMGAPETAFTVVYEEVERENWVKDVFEPKMAPNRDKILIDHGKTV